MCSCYGHFSCSAFRVQWNDSKSMSRNTHWCDSKTDRSFYCLLTTDVYPRKQVICRTLFFQIVRCTILQLWKVTLWSTSTFSVTRVLKCDAVTHSSSKNNLKINNQKISVSLPLSVMLKLQFWRFACHSEQRRYFDVTLKRLTFI